MIFRYSAFAVISIIVNLGSQRAVLAVLPDGWRLVPGITPDDQAVLLAIAVGTGAGLVTKYLLDKRWIFFDTSKGARAHSERFTRYTMTGLVTTAIFWGMEYTFYQVWSTDAMRELGAVIGLTIGYVVKFQLDKRFVFFERTA
nr:GtrA family protein [Pseudoruegeria sp. HB172150]